MASVHKKHGRERLCSPIMHRMQDELPTHQTQKTRLMEMIHKPGFQKVRRSDYAENLVPRPIGLEGS